MRRGKLLLGSREKHKGQSRVFLAGFSAFEILSPFMESRSPKNEIIIEAKDRREKSTHSNSSILQLDEFFDKIH